MVPCTPFLGSSVWVPYRTESPDWPSQPVYPDTVGVTFDPRAGQLTCVYNDHSVYVWDVQNVLNPTKVYSALYHSGCVWGAQVLQ